MLSDETLLDATEEEQNTRETRPNFWLVRLDETDDWCPEIRKKCRRIYSVFLYDASEHTYCCEMTPSYYLRHLYSSAVFRKRDRENYDLHEWMDTELAEGNASCDQNRYVHTYNIDAIPNKRWLKYHIGDPFAESVPGPLTEEQYDDMIEGLLEYYNGNWML